MATLKVNMQIRTCLNRVIQERRRNGNVFFLLVHLNINSCLNKLEELILGK